MCGLHACVIAAIYLRQVVKSFFIVAIHLSHATRGQLRLDAPMARATQRRSTPPSVPNARWRPAAVEPRLRLARAS